MSFVCTQFKCKNTSISPIYWTLSSVSIPDQSGPGSNDNEGILCILQSSSITGASPSYCLVSYPGHSLSQGVSPFCIDAVSVFYCPS